MSLGQNVFVGDRASSSVTDAKIQNNVSIYEGVGVLEEDLFWGHRSCSPRPEPTGCIPHSHQDYGDVRPARGHYRRQRHHRVRVGAGGVGVRRPAPSYVRRPAHTR